MGSGGAPHSGRPALRSAVASAGYGLHNAWALGVVVPVEKQRVKLDLAATPTPAATQTRSAAS